MDIRVYSNGVELSESVYEYIEKRLEKVERVFTGYSKQPTVEARFNKDAYEFVLILKTHFNGKDLVVQEKANDIYAVIDSATDAFDKVLKKERDVYKSYHKSNVKGTIEALAEELQPKYELDEEDELYEKIDNVKRTYLAHVTLEEAIAQAEVMNRMFFVFRNIETGEINLLYRKNGKFGLMEFED